MSVITLKPRMSEKAFQESQLRNTYVFEVPLQANTNMIARAVEAEFKVTVEDVRTLVAKGKTKRSYRKGARPAVGKRVNSKKAYVSLKSGDSINIFGQEDKAEKKKSSAPVKAEKPAVQADATQKRGLKGVLGRAPRQTQNRGGEK